MNAGLIGEYAQGCFQRMGQIAHLGAGAFDHFRVGFQQQVQFIGDRLDLIRIAAGNTLLLAFANFRQFALQVRQRPQAISDLQKDCRNKPQAQQAKHGNQCIVERRHFGLQFIEVSCHKKGILFLAAEQGKALFNDPQRVPGLVREVSAHAVARPPVRFHELRKRQPFIEQRSGCNLPRGIAIQRRNLPVPTRQRNFKPRVSQNIVDFRHFLLKLNRRQQTIHHGLQACVETALNRSGEQGTQQNTGGDQQHDTDNRSSGNQPEGK